MDATRAVLHESGLRFFGKMSAANAHEIKNALAVINENGGLLGDLLDMAEKGRPLDPERLRRIAVTVKQQVARADEIAKSTNRFAHSVDKAGGPADLEQSLALIKTMAMRFATRRHIRIEIVPGPSAITLLVQPFMLLHLLWLCVQYAMEHTSAENTLRIAMSRSGRETIVRYGPLSGMTEASVMELGASAEMEALLQLHNGRLATDPRTGDLLLELTKTVAPV